jgi:hypothetical protein
MPQYFGIWKFNTNLPPPQDPKLAVQQAEAFQALIKSQLQSGVVKESHAFLEGTGGYFITGDVTDEATSEALTAWTPFVTFELHKTIPITRAIEAFVKTQRMRAGM